MTKSVLTHPSSTLFDEMSSKVFFSGRTEIASDHGARTSQQLRVNVTGNLSQAFDGLNQCFDLGLFQSCLLYSDTKIFVAGDEHSVTDRPVSRQDDHIRNDQRIDAFLFPDAIYKSKPDFHIVQMSEG
jgi:hypothetical protein